MEFLQLCGNPIGRCPLKWTNSGLGSTRNTTWIYVSLIYFEFPLRFTGFISVDGTWTTYVYPHSLWTQELLLMYCRNCHCVIMYLDIYTYIFYLVMYIYNAPQISTTVYCLLYILCPKIFMHHISYIIRYS